MQITRSMQAMRLSLLLFADNIIIFLHVNVLLFDTLVYTINFNTQI